jgi:23S rRNA (uridine2552-2'-O)-methyltransferase
VGEGAARIAAELLKPGGNFVAKIYEGEDLGRFMDSLRPTYRNVRAHSPPASRDESKEIYVIAQGFKPPATSSRPRLRLKVRPDTQPDEQPQDGDEKLS